jgi:hypothetical protein
VSDVEQAEMVLFDPVEAIETVCPLTGLL